MRLRLALLAAILCTALIRPTAAVDAGRSCELVAPVAPLTSPGLSSVYRLNGCSEGDPNNAAFVQATIFDPATGTVSVYSPLVVSGASQPAVPPTPISLPANAVVALWVGSNSGVHVDEDDPNFQFVQGTPGSFFGQQSYLNVPHFLQAVAGRLSAPALGTAADGLPCPTSRDFSLVDADPSDNTTTQYLITASGQTAQDTPANRASLGMAFTFNGSDERLLTAKLDKALGCSPWKVPDLADATGAQQSTDGLLNEIQAASLQPAPVALVPALDPFTLRRGVPDLPKLNAYRQQVDQPAVSSLADADTATYCARLLDTGEPRLRADQSYENAISSPFPNLADTLGHFLARRFNDTWAILGCQPLIGVASPVTLSYDANGVVVAASWV